MMFLYGQGSHFSSLGQCGANTDDVPVLASSTTQLRRRTTHSVAAVSTASVSLCP